jgi:predicted transporter
MPFGLALIAVILVIFFLAFVGKLVEAHSKDIETFMSHVGIGIVIVLAAALLVLAIWIISRRPGH